jgi:hypothetical protein
MRRLVPVVVVAGLVALLPSCGGGGGSGPSAVATPPADCVQTVLVQGNADLDAGTALGQEFTVTSTAATRLDVIVDWTFAQSPIGVYVFQGACNLDQFLARTCNFLVQSEISSRKPRLASVTNVPAGTYTLLIANFGSLNESLAAQIVLSSATCPALGTAGLGSASGSWKPLGK